MMSQSHSNEVSSSVVRNNAIQKKMAARQVKRAAKAAERREKSDSLKDEGNALFREGDFHGALERYQQAVNVHGPSIKPVLLTDMSAVYLKLGMYPEAHDAADRALVADPKSVKARYHRGIARKHMKMWTGASIDFRTLLFLEPENKAVEAEWASVQEKSLDPLYQEDDDEELQRYSDHEAPALEDDPEPGESLSESSDCEHKGNGIPCKFYNRLECKNGRACRFSHAPDSKSERDALGRNVCRYYLIGVCKYGERCSYSHSKDYLLQKGWWSTREGIDKEKKRYDLIQMCNQAIADYDELTKASGTAKTPKKKQPKGKKRGGESGVTCAGNRSIQVQSTFGMGQSSRKTNTRSKRRPSVHSYTSWGGCDSDAYDNGMCGFTGGEVEELLCQGIKPWDDDAWDAMDALLGN